MAQNTNIHQSIEEITVSYLKEISGLKKELSDLQLKVEKKENELSKAKLRIGELEAQVSKK